MQYVLSLLWEKREERQDRVITLEDYTAFGGLEKALEERANRLYHDFTPEQQALCQRIFLRLVKPGEGAEDTRRRAGLHEFKTQEERAVLKKLTDARLVITQGVDKQNTNGNEQSNKRDATPINQDSAYAEVSHEALIRTWSLLKEWIEANRDDMRIQHQISADTNEWLEQGKNRDWLLAGTRLSVAKEWLDKDPDQPNEDERVYIQSSSKLQRRKKRLIYTLTIIVLVFVSLVAQVFYIQKTETQEQLLEANYNLAKFLEEKALNMITNDILTGKAEPTKPGQLKEAWLYGLEAASQRVPEGKVAALPKTIERISLLSLQDLATARQQTPFFNTESVAATTFTPDGKNLATWSDNTTMQLWNSATGKTRQIHTEHTAPIIAIAFSPDRKTLATGSEDTTVRLWDIATGKARYPIIKHTSPIWRLAFSPDGKTLATQATGSMDTARLWDITGKTSHTLIEHKHTGPILALAFSPDGKTLATGSYATVRLWDATTGKTRQIRTGQNGHIWTLAFSPDGKNFATESNDHTVRLWDTATGNARYTLTGHTNSITMLAFSPDGKTLATGSKDTTVRLWDIATGKARYPIIKHTSPMRLAFSPNSKTLATGSEDATVSLWDTSTGKLLQHLTRHTGMITILAFSPDGKTLATGSSDSNIRLWDITTANKARYILTEHTSPILTLTFNPDGKTLATGSEVAVRLWDTNTGNTRYPLTEHTSPIGKLAFSPNGKTLATESEDNTVRLWDASTGKTRILTGHTNSITKLAFSPDGNTLATGSWDTTVRFWDTITGTLLHTLNGHTLPIISIAFSPDGNTLATGSWDATVRLWDTVSGKAHRILKYPRPHNSPISMLAFSPNGKTLATTEWYSNEVWLWDTATSKARHALREHTDTIRTLDFSPNGKTLATGSDDTTVRLWDTTTGKARYTLTEHTDPIRTLSFSPNGKILATGSDDTTVRLWDTSTGKTRYTLTEHTGPIRTLSFSPKGKTLATGSDDTTVRLFEMSPQIQRLVYDFDPKLVFKTFKFLWQMDRKELDYTRKPNPLTLSPQMGYYITWISETCKYRPLLDMPRPEENKFDQIVRFLEDRCAYKEDHPDKENCEEKPSTTCNNYRN